MNRLKPIVDIIKISLSFDDALKAGKYCDLQQQNDLIKSHLQNAILLNANNNIDKSLLDLSKQLYEINDDIIVSINNSNTKVQKNAKNTLLFLYRDQCASSEQFTSEWNKLKSMVNGKVNMVAINCTKQKHAQLCKMFGTYEYPSIKYLYDNNKLHSYIGNMNANEIFATYIQKID